MKKILKDISPTAWEHPSDRAALNALRAIPGLDLLIKKFIGATSERALRYLALSSTVRTSARQFPLIHSLTRQACEILDQQIQPEVYISQNPLMNAMVIGVDHPFIVVHSSLAEILTEEEMLAVLAHEVAHCASGHVLYKTLLYILINLSQIFLNVPFSYLVLRAIILALAEWDRKSELSADRAGLLAVQDLTPCLNLEMKIAGGRQTSQMNLEDFLEQAYEYDQGDDIVGGIYKLLNMINQSHPFPVVRIAELKKWHDSGEYQRILSGDYRTSAAEDIFQGFQAAGDQYREDLKQSPDPLAKTFSSLVQGMENFGKQAEDFFKSIFDPDDEDE